MKYYKHVESSRDGDDYQIRARGAGSDSLEVLATTYNSVFADRIVDLLNEDERKAGRQS